MIGFLKLKNIFLSPLPLLFRVFLTMLKNIRIYILIVIFIVMSLQSSLLFSSPNDACIMISEARTNYSNEFIAPTRNDKNSVSKLDKKVLQPITENEIRLLISTLKPTIKGANKKDVNKIIKGSEISLTRFAVILDDINILLAGIHAQETLEEIQKQGGIKDEERNWVDKYLLPIIDCVPNVFSERGGISAFEESHILVLKYRKQLEDMILRFHQDGRIIPVKP